MEVADPMDLLSQIHFQEQAESPSSHSLRCPLGRLDWLVYGRDLSSLFCSVNVILEFLQDLVAQGRAVRTIRGYITAISIVMG